MSEYDSVESDEFVFRRIAPAFFDASLPIAIQREAFRPTSSDTTGLSVFRAKFAHPTDTLASLDPAKAAGYYVSRLSVRALMDIGLTVVPDPLSNGPAGHAVIPEVNCQAYQSRKQEMKPILLELARLASDGIVHLPK